MVAILVMLIVTAFLVAELIAIHLSHRRAASKEPAPRPITQDSIVMADGLFYAPGHSWAYLGTEGTLSVGMDDFLRKMLGKFDRLELPPLGAEVKEGKPLFKVLQGSRELSIPSPVSGAVEAVNSELLESPNLIALYPQGWVVRLKPDSLAAGLSRFCIGDKARAWLRAEFDRLRDFFSELAPRAVAVGSTLMDGGLPVEGALAHLDEDSWQRFVDVFLRQEPDPTA